MKESPTKQNSIPRWVCISGLLLFASAALSSGASAQNCPKVAYTTPAATTKSLVAAVNCLSATSEASPKAVPAKGNMQVDSFQIIGPQHSRPYSSVVLAVLSVPTSGGTKTAVVTPDTHEATITAEAGGTCSVKINADKTVDSRCYIAGGTVFIVYR
jgi:hypothetical protein